MFLLRWWSTAWNWLDAKYAECNDYEWFVVRDEDMTIPEWRYCDDKCMYCELPVRVPLEIRGYSVCDVCQDKINW